MQRKKKGCGGKKIKLRAKLEVKKLLNEIWKGKTYRGEKSRGKEE